MNWLFIVSVFSIIYVWKAKEYLRDEMRIVHKWQNENSQLHYALLEEIDKQRNNIRDWEHKIDIMDEEIRELKKLLKKEGGADV